MKVALWGCGGHASVVFETIRAEGKHEVVAFVDDHKSGLYLARPIFKISALPPATSVRLSSQLVTKRSGTSLRPW